MYSLKSHFDPQHEATGTPSYLDTYGHAPNWQFQFSPVVGPNWDYVRQHIRGSGTWQMGRINRLKFWLKLSPSVVPSGHGYHNFEVGTFLREIGDPTTLSESPWAGNSLGVPPVQPGLGSHWYHMYDLYPMHGTWLQVIVDTHPNHIRQDNGNAERGDILHPSTQTPANTYFDLMVRFYLDFWNAQTYLCTAPNGALPCSTSPDFYMDDFSFYEETRNEDTDHIYSVWGAYDTTDNEIRVGWCRNKDDNATHHQVRYAFSDIAQLGWANATAAPGGDINPANFGDTGNNNLEWHSTAINVTGHNMIYIAIKQAGSETRFRQIAVPTRLEPPTDLRIIK